MSTEIGERHSHLEVGYSQQVMGHSLLGVGHSLLGVRHSHLGMGGSQRSENGKEMTEVTNELLEKIITVQKNSDQMMMSLKVTCFVLKLSKSKVWSKLNGFLEGPM